MHALSIWPNIPLKQKNSSTARDAFINVISYSKRQNLICRLMIKSVGEKDMGMREAMHQILGLKLYQVIKISLDNLSRNNIKVDEPDLEHYKSRLKHSKEFMSVNLAEYFSKNSTNNEVFH